MKKFFYFAILLSGLTISFSACKKKDPVPEPNPNPDTRTINPISQFVYDGLSTYYLWSDGMINKKPTVNDQDPEIYFESVLNTIDKSHGWSFITDDVQGLLASFSGEPVEFGFSVTFAAANEAGTEYYAIIKYVFPNSPASNAGLKRADLIGKINGQPITESNYRILFGSSAASFTTYKISNTGIELGKTITITPAKIATDPVLYSHIFEIGGKKIAYLFYTDFIDNYNGSLYKAFSQFKQAGATELVLDLRYNHGGRITAATYLSSLIAPKTVVENKSPFATLSYNSFLNQLFDKNKWSRTDSLGIYSSSEQNPLDANLNLSKVYIIATGDSYSASELTAFCLKPYMEVVHIGGNTGGKYTASWTIHPYDENIGIPIYDIEKLSSTQKTTFRNWAMQPIVAKYTNYKGEDFSNPGYIAPTYSMKEGNGYVSNWKQIGDSTDTFLSQAIYLITGDGAYKPATGVPMSRMKVNEAASIKLNNPKDVAKEAVILDTKKISSRKFQEIINSK